MRRSNQAVRATSPEAGEQVRPVLEWLMEDRSGLVREHAAWGAAAPDLGLERAAARPQRYGVAGRSSVAGRSWARATAARISSQSSIPYQKTVQASDLRAPSAFWK